MANIKKYSAKKRMAKKSASKGKTIDTLACGCCGPIVRVDDCGCLETPICC